MKKESTPTIETDTRVVDSLAQALTAISMFDGKDRADKILKVIEDNADEMGELLNAFYDCVKVECLRVYPGEITDAKADA